MYIEYSNWNIRTWTTITYQDIYSEYTSLDLAGTYNLLSKYLKDVTWVDNIFYAQYLRNHIRMN